MAILRRISMFVNIRYHRGMSVLAEIEVPESGVCCSPLTAEPLAASDAEDMARTFKALGDPTRLRLISIVAASAGQEACVCDLTEPVGLSQPTVSHHLRILTEAGFLSRSKRGSWAYYSLVPGSLEKLAAALLHD